MGESCPRSRFLWSRATVTWEAWSLWSFLWPLWKGNCLVTFFKSICTFVYSYTVCQCFPLQFWDDTTATATKTSPENITLFHLCYFAIFWTRSTSSETANYPGTNLIGVAFKLKKKMKNSPSCVDVLHKTLNVVISRCCFEEDSKEMYQNVKRTCRAIVFAH